MKPQPWHYHLVSEVFAAGASVDLVVVAKTVGRTVGACEAVLRSAWGRAELERYYAATRQALVTRRVQPLEEVGERGRSGGGWVGERALDGGGTGERARGAGMFRRDPGASRDGPREADGEDGDARHRSDQRSRVARENHFDRELPPELDGPSQHETPRLQVRMGAT